MDSISQITFQNNKAFRMYVPKLTKSRHLFVILLITLTFQQCSSPKTFSWKTDKSDQILDGSVHKDILNNPEKFPWFYYGKQAYKPDTAAVRILKGMDTSLYVMIFAGSWCADTQKELPIFFKVAEAAGINNSHIGVLMVDKNKQSAYFNVNAMEIRHIPTFIVYRNGKELGRIVEKTEVSMEADLLKIALLGNELK